MRLIPEEPVRIKADHLISVGPNCRPAGQLRDNHMKRTRFPLDWMGFSAETLVHCMDTDFSDFFLDFKELPFKGEPPQIYYFARDVRNDIRSIHDLPLEKPLEEAVRDFRALSRRRWETFCARMADAKTAILFGAYPDPKDAQLILRSFQKRFPDTVFHMVNISHRENCPEDEIYAAHPCGCFDQYYMCELFEPYEWKGNINGWNTVLSFYSANRH